MPMSACASSSGPAARYTPCRPGVRNPFYDTMRQVTPGPILASALAVGHWDHNATTGESSHAFGTTLASGR